MLGKCYCYTAGLEPAAGARNRRKATVIQRNPPVRFLSMIQIDITQA